MLEILVKGGSKMDGVLFVKIEILYVTFCTVCDSELLAIEKF